MIQFEEFEIDEETKQLFHKKELIKKLSKKQFEILNFMVENENSLSPTTSLLLRVWNRDDIWANNTMRVYINALRNLLSVSDVVRIENIHSEGFILKTK